MITENFDGIFPKTIEELKTFKGIGRSTAGAIAAISMQIRAPILDGNVKRVLARYRAIEGWPGHTAVSNRLWVLAEELLPSIRVASYTQAIMDLGATVCVRSNPACGICPLRHDCLAYQNKTIENFPGRKPSKEIPVRSITMFILTNESHQVLLYKRPPDGIWGSLYSLPESPNNKTIPQLRSLGSESNDQAIGIENAIVMDPIRHTFSHYHLDIQPIRLAINPDKLTVGNSEEWLWYPLNQSVEVGLAAPVKKLLSQISPQ
jgi:A/G-specific adenine glycosylase